MNTKPTTLLSRRLKQLLPELALTYGEFAQIVGIPLQRLQNMANSRTARLNLVELRNITSIYDINPSWFTNETAEKIKPFEAGTKLTKKRQDLEAQLTTILLKDLKSNGPLTQQICMSVRQFGRHL